MNRKVIKIMSIVLTIAMLATMVTPVFALTPNELTANTTATGTTEIETFGENIMGILQVVGVVIAVVVLIILGIKYMMGSASEKAEYKKTMIPYVVGAILIFASTTIANVIYQFANGLKS